MATQRLRDRLDVAAGRVLSRWDSRGVWRNDQSLSPAASLSRELNAATRTTRSRLRRARTFERVAAVTAGIEVGSVSADHVDLLAKAQRTAPERYAADEAMLIKQCATPRFADAERLVAYWLQHVARTAPNGPPPTPPSRPRRRCRRRSTERP